MKQPSEHCAQGSLDADRSCCLAGPGGAAELAEALTEVKPGPIDLPAALAAVDGDRELLAEVVRAFQGEYPQQVAALKSALAAGKHEQASLYAHALKGSLTTLGAAAGAA